MVIDPWGAVIAQAPDAVGIIRAELDLDRVRALRSQIPVLANRRPGAYEPDRATPRFVARPAGLPDELDADGLSVIDRTGADRPGRDVPDEPADHATGAAVATDDVHQGGPIRRRGRCKARKEYRGYPMVIAIVRDVPGS